MKMFGDVGRGTLGIFEYAGGAAALSVETSGFIGRLKIRGTETLVQAFALGVASFPIVFLTSLFTGMVITLESANQAESFGVSSVVGGAVAYVSSRELGPILTAVVVAGRAGAAIAAELGSMVVTEQIEALEALGLSPVQYLVVPRLLALMVMLPLLTIFADVVSIIGGMYLAERTAHISYAEFISSARQISAFEDYLKGMLKAVFFAVIIVIIGCYQGLGVRGGAAGVGKATTGAVVTAIILIFIANFALSLILFGTNGAQ